METKTVPFAMDLKFYTSDEAKGAEPHQKHVAVTSCGLQAVMACMKAIDMDHSSMSTVLVMMLFGWAMEETENPKALLRIIEEMAASAPPDLRDIYLRVKENSKHIPEINSADLQRTVN